MTLGVCVMSNVIEGDDAVVREAVVREGDLLWQPSTELIENCNASHFMAWLAEHKGLRFDDYEGLWQWSVDALEDFWGALWEYFDIKAHSPYERVLGRREMPGAEWFPGATLNYAEHVFRNGGGEKIALYHQSESGPLRTLTWDAFEDQTRRVANSLKALGVGFGDRVVAYLPNIPEAVIAFEACASLGAIWSSCSPDFGTPTVIDRFSQVEPKVLLAVDGYSYSGKKYDRCEVVAQLKASLPSVEHVVFLPYLNPQATVDGIGDVVLWEDLLREQQGASQVLEFTPVPFDHPLWILYSSGTTGMPKAIVHGHGGVLLEHLKSHSLHLDLGADDRFFWFTTTSWVMWNMLVGGLLTGSSIVLFDGNPAYPDLGVLWRLVERLRVRYFGGGAAYFASCMKAGMRPGEEFDLSALKTLGSTGSPLAIDTFGWCYEAIKRDLWVASASGGTDIAGGFVGGIPFWPVRAGEIQGRMLGARVEAYSDAGEPVIDEVGEMVITAPMPSMPTFFWNDENDVRYKESYFEMFPGVWRHGDFLKVTSRGSCIIYGRSDSTLNRYGIRVGTSEVYRIVEGIPEIGGALIVNLDRPGGEFFMPLFIVLNEGCVLDDELKGEISRCMRRDISPRHVPDAIFAVDEIPTTLTGKKMEVPVRKILSGTPVENAINRDAMVNPESVDFFAALARELNTGGTVVG